jgi:dienelactone hydrolase
VRRSLPLLALLFGLTSTAVATQQAPPPAQQSQPAQQLPPAQQTLPPPTQAPSPKAIAAAEAAVDALAARDFAKVFAQFAPPMQTALSPEKLSATWDTIQAQAGGYVKRVGSRAEVRGMYTVVIVTCDFERNKVEVIATIDASNEIAGLQARPAQPAAVYAPPDYATPAAFTETEVTIGTGQWALPGTLTMPVGAGPFPAIVLVHGSGPNDRDETFGPNKTFKDLALGLGSRGVAVLRYDKRTKVYQAIVAKLNPFTLKEEAIDDAVLAVALLRKDPRVAGTHIFVLGHSLGGTAAPRIGAADPGIAGLIMMAGAVRPLEQSIVDQMQYLADADGVISEAEKRALDGSLKLKEMVNALTAADVTSTTAIGGAPASYWLDLKGYDPAALAATLKQRLLVLQGGRDYQVTMADFERWKTALAKHPAAEFKVYPALNHLFLPGQGKSLPPEYSVPGHVPVEVIADIAAWVKR